MFPAATVRFALVLAAALALSACQSSEERAEAHYQGALELMAAGDTERALVELRNVFDLNGTHREARALYADTLLEMGRDRDAYGQYLRLSEQHPDDLDARLALARIAIDQQDWEEVRRHGEAARKLAPNDPNVQMVGINIDYADALEKNDVVARRKVVDRAAALSEEQPEELQLRRILVDSALRDQDMEAALAQIESALLIAPDERSLYDTRLSLLAGLGRPEDLEATLIEMIARFPTDVTIVSNLVRFYVSRDELDEAEAFLRTRASEVPATRADGAEIDLVQFLLELRGPDVALEELDRAIAARNTPEGEDANGNTASVFQSLRAQIRFDQGETGAAVAEMEEILAEAGDGLEANDDRVILARMLDRMGNRVGAQRLVGEVLDYDRTQADALKLEAGWRIAADQADGAISLLRTALDEAPQDVEALTLMAQAHLRNGNRDLARDMLSLAVQASNSSAAETRRYVVLLLEDRRYQLAEEVLLDALRVAPGNTDLLLDLGRVYIQQQDWSRTRQVEQRLRNLETPAGLRAADGMQVARLSSEGRTEEAISVLQDLADENAGDIPAQIAVVRARLMNNDIEGALSYVDDLVAGDPENISLNMIQAAALSAAGQQEQVIEIYRRVLAANNQIEGAWVGLLRALFAQGDIDEGEVVLDEGLTAMPDALNLLWAQASLLERTKDFEGALVIYEKMYERVPEAPVIVNNYASLLSSLRDDAESLERAYLVARRLRDSDQAPFQDTYGWIAHLRGDSQDAITHLEPAAATLEEDPLVQYHLAEVYLALGRDSEAQAQFELALDLAGDDPRPQFDTARERLAELTATTPEGGAAGE